MIELMNSAIELNSGDRILQFAGGIVVRFHPGKSNPGDPWRVTVSSSDDEDLQSLLCCKLASYTPTAAEVSFGQECCVKAYTSMVSKLGMTI